ncbi:MAG: PilZ domain-containing protein [Deltaproteobacteria bacterium]|nr:PilZ domain-containing protein [Deltaproteobacteria bacterium]TLN01833.1 MAG: PilZ domain-containing protein [bacterium]
MVTFHSNKKSKQVIPWKYLLGKSVAEIIPYTGEPFASYLYQGEEVYLYDKGTISTIVVRNGIVVRCDDLTETRRALRIIPSEKVPAMLIGERRISGYLKDLSVTGAAFHFPNEAEFSIGDRQEISFTIAIEGISRYFEISCRVHDIRVLSQEKAAIVLFDLTDVPKKKRLLFRYVQLNSIRAELGLKGLFIKTNSLTAHNSNN